MACEKGRVPDVKSFTREAPRHREKKKDGIVVATLSHDLLPFSVPQCLRGAKGLTRARRLPSPERPAGNGLALSFLKRGPTAGLRTGKRRSVRSAGAARSRERCRRGPARRRCSGRTPPGATAARPCGS